MWEEKGSPIPKKSLSPGGGTRETNPPEPPVVPHPRDRLSPEDAPELREADPPPIPAGEGAEEVTCPAPRPAGR